MVDNTFQLSLDDIAGENNSQFHIGQNSIVDTKIAVLLLTFTRQILMQTICAPNIFDFFFCR